MLRSIISGLLVLACMQASAQKTAADTSAQAAKVSLKDSVMPHQLRFGIDAARFVVNSIDPTRIAYDGSLDYYYKKEIYFVAEGGFGNSKVDYTDLKYTTNNYYFKLGVDRVLVPRIARNDWDAFFIGARYAYAGVQRGAATYITNDPIWGSTSGTVAAQNFNAQWAELTAGIRLNLYKGLMTGWNVRGKFLFNAKSFRELPPAFIAGYGKGDKSTTFDFNVYLLYALRW